MVIGVPCVEVIFVVVVFGVVVTFVVVVFGNVEDEVFTVVFDVTAVVECSCVVVKVANKPSFFVLEYFIK